MYVCVQCRLVPLKNMRYARYCPRISLGIWWSFVDLEKACKDNLKWFKVHKDNINHQDCNIYIYIVVIYVYFIQDFQDTLLLSIAVWFSPPWYSENEGHCFVHISASSLPLAIAETVKRNPGDICVGFSHELDPKHCIGCVEYSTWCSWCWLVMANPLWYLNMIETILSLQSLCFTPYL